jgi:uncharacterized protein YkwD
MKHKTLTLLILFIASISNAQKWTKAQLDLANTAKNITYLTKVEKEAILYINLCRLFPKEFAQNEVIDYFLDPTLDDSTLSEFASYKKTLINDLVKRKPCKALTFDKVLYSDAKCYANEISVVDREGHDRVICKKSNYAECISFGQQTGKKIALQLLIDAGVESLGHRNICLDKAYKKIGLCSTSHFRWKCCAVVEII